MIPDTIHHRLRRGWTPEEAETIPVGTWNPRLKKERAESTIAVRCKAVGLSVTQFYRRRKMGMTTEKALTTPVLQTGPRKRA